MNKRNAALSAIGAQPEAPKPTVVTTTAEPASVPAQAAAPEKVTQLPRPARASKTVDKVMLYLPPKVARKFKEMAFHEDCKAHDLYLQALADFLRAKGHGSTADILAEKLANKG